MAEFLTLTKRQVQSYENYKKTFSHSLGGRCLRSVARHGSNSFHAARDKRSGHPQTEGPALCRHRY
jgi:hypothetical protein